MATPPSKMATPAKATCPICNQEIPFKDINSHIDSCLAGQETTSENLKDDAAKDCDAKSQLKRKRNDGGTADLTTNEQPKKRSAWGPLMRSPVNRAQKTAVDKRTMSSESKPGFSKPGLFKTPSSPPYLSATSSAAATIASSSSAAEQALNEPSNSRVTDAVFSTQQKKPKSKVDFR